MKPHYSAYQEHIRQLIQAAVSASDPAQAVERHLHRDGRLLTINEYTYDLVQGRVFLISLGKAAVTMGLAAVNILGNRLTAAILVTKKSNRDWGAEIEAAVPDTLAGRLTLFQGGHPISDQDSVQAANAVIQMLSQTTADDLVLCLISGGASAVHTAPLIPLEEWQRLNDGLIASGCTINELNLVRRHLDRVKGGGLARLAAPAACISLILSDVVGNPLEMIGSGPTVFTSDAPSAALSILNRYGKAVRLNAAAWKRITEALGNNSLYQDSLPLYLDNIIVGDVSRAAQMSLVKAAQLGFLTQTLTTYLEGEAREVGRVAASLAKSLPPGRCLILGGETTVTVQGKGRGGRNQEMALAAAIALDGWRNIVVACFSTDGEDGLTPYAGAMVNGKTVSTARSKNLDPATYLDNNDSTSFFEQIEKGGEIDGRTAVRPHLIKTGPTGTNVNDLVFILTYPDSQLFDEEE